MRTSLKYAKNAATREICGSRSRIRVELHPVEILQVYGRGLTLDSNRRRRVMCIVDPGSSRIRSRPAVFPTRPPATVQSLHRRLRPRCCHLASPSRDRNSGVEAEPRRFKTETETELSVLRFLASLLVTLGGGFRGGRAGSPLLTPLGDGPTPSRYS